MPQYDQIEKVIEIGVSQVNINARDLGHAIAAMAQEAARNRLKAGGLTTGAAVAGGSNVGNGAVTIGAPSTGPGVMAGDYTATCITAATDSGTFEVTDPNGAVIGNAVVGTLFEGPIRFTIADGATDFDVDDEFTFTVTASGVASLTDNSSGVAAASLAAIVTPTVAAVDNVVDMAPKAGFDTAIGKVEDAHGEISAAINQMIDLIAGAGYPDIDAFSAAAAADGTIAALDKSLTATTADDAGVEDATGIAQIVAARNNQAMLCSALNFVRTALGLAPITDGTGGAFTRDAEGNWENTTAAATGTAAPNGANSLTDATVDTALDALADNVATLAASINGITTGLAIGPFVVATQNAGWKFNRADVTG